MESQWLATPSPNKSLKAVQFSLRLLHLRVFRFHCAEEPEMWDFNWDIFLGLLACGAFQFGVTGPPTLWYSGSAFEPKASSHLFAATSFVSKYQVATEVLTAVSESSLALRLNQEMTLLPCTREFPCALSEWGFQMAVQRFPRRSLSDSLCNCGMSHHALKLTAFTDVEIPPLACNQICSKFLAGYSGGFLNSQSPRDRHYLHCMTIQSGISSARGLPEDRM
jgi:hypothetical protein